ncbi:torsin-like protein isoform X2 [Armigeres subalbatus]|uniref:torsin-like protein isoform X2 n=1 Tax=Armigeres subalbatus TaxID=124917 RepID=UPI002ED66D85
MLLRKSTSVCLLLLSIHVSVLAAFEPFSFTTAAIGAGLGWLKWDSVMDNTYCKAYECCRKPYLKWNVEGLKHDLKNFLYGQHIVEDVLVNAIGAHLDNIESSRKPLVLSFHGTSGTGKNFVSDFVASSLYENGINSKFVYKFTASDTLKDLAADVKQTVKNCEYSLFIFDEIEKMQSGVFDTIVALLDHHSSLKGYNFTKAIFIFLSNSAGIEIARKLKSLMDAGNYRDKTKLGDFERIAELGAYNVIGGLYRSRIIESHVIDHFIPFLPLESRHVELCIAKELRNTCPSLASNENVGKILKEAMTYDDTEMFSNNGCKRISKKVESYCYKQQKKKSLK